MSFGGPHLKCLHPDQAELVMAEIHEGQSYQNSPYFRHEASRNVGDLIGLHYKEST